MCAAVETGYGNLISDIKSDHNDCEDIRKAKDSKNPSIFVIKKGTKVFKWLQWIVMSNLPFQFIEDPLTRKNTNLESTTDETGTKYLVLGTESVEKRIAEDLPEKFGMIIDGWSDGTSHYIAMLSSYSVLIVKVGIDCSPI
jgi:hypothetical protein